VACADAKPGDNSLSEGHDASFGRDAAFNSRAMKRCKPGEKRHSMLRSRIGNLIRIALILTAACISIGWGSSWQELKSASGSIKSVSGEFVQEKHMKILAKPLISSGVFYFQTPGSLRWEYRAPLRDILLMDNDRVERYVGTTSGFVKEAGVNLEAMQVVLEQITQWLHGQFDENPMFSAKLEPGPKIVLLPKEQAFTRMIQRIELLFGDRPGIIDTVTIYESDESFTRIVFKNVVLNQPLDDSIFRKVS
jgi:outer membrane lipoprotein-sorting protein